jgi:hypothetical protein
MLGVQKRVHIFLSSGLGVEAPKVIDMPQIWDLNSVEITQSIRSRSGDLLDHVRAFPI